MTTPDTGGLPDVVSPVCSHPECEVGETGRCRLRGLQHETCPHFKDQPSGPPRAADPADHTRLLWTGRALTPVTLPLIAGEKRPHLVAVVGLPRSGKTSFLTSLFMRVRRHNLAPLTFAGSLTLAGWSLLSRYADWTPGVPQQFPPRTSGAQRESGFLHLAFRDAHDRLVDVALADAPGEWFEEWVLKDPGNTSLAHPPGWLVANATTVLFFVDTPGLFDEFDANVVLDQTVTLADRVAAGQPQRVSVIYAQADRTPPGPSSHLGALQRHLERVFPDHRSFHTSSVWNGQEGRGVLEALQSMLSEDTTPRPLGVEPHERTFAGWLRGNA